METKTKRRLEWISFSVLGLIIFLAGSLFFYQFAYAGKIYRNVNVAGIEIGGKTKAQASFLIQKQYSEILNQDITLKTQDKEIKTKVSDTGLDIDADKIIQNSYKIGRDSNFFKQLYLSAATVWQKHAVSVETKIDPAKYNDFLKIAIDQFNSQPKDASLVIENGQVKEVKEEEGITVKTDNLTEKILRLANPSNNSKVLFLDYQKIAPTVVTANFTEAEQNANNILNKHILLNYNDQRYSPSRTEIGLWISFTTKDNKVSVSLNDNNIQAYLNKIAKNFEVQKKDRRINAVDGSVIEQGQEGNLLDKTSALKSVKDQIFNNNDVTVALSTYTVPPSEVKVFPAEGLVPGRFEGKYVDIDLTLQKLCRIEGTNIIDCFPVSSGKPGMATPTGTYPIIEKSPRHWSAEYHMWLPWWQRFISSGYGIHELPETNNWKETDAHLGTPVSHGCVRLGVGPAETVYNWTEMGTIVYVHK